MKKYLFPLFLLFAIFLTACGGTNATPALEETQATLPTIVPVDSGAQCIAQSAERVDYAQEGDWIKGAAEGYAITLVEYADFQ